MSGHNSKFYTVNVSGIVFIYLFINFCLHLLQILQPGFNRIDDNQNADRIH